MQFLSNQQLINLVIYVSLVCFLKQRKSIKIFSFHQILYNTFNQYWLLYKLLKEKQNCFCHSNNRSEKIVLRVRLLLNCRSSNKMHYGKYSLKWNISRLGKTAELTGLFAYHFAEKNLQRTSIVYVTCKGITSCPSMNMKSKTDICC